MKFCPGCQELKQTGEGTTFGKSVKIIREFCITCCLTLETKRVPVKFNRENFIKKEA